MAVVLFIPLTPHKSDCHMVVGYMFNSLDIENISYHTVCNLFTDRRIKGSMPEHMADRDLVPVLSCACDQVPHFFFTCCKGLFKKQVIAQYDGHIRMADKAFGELVAKIKKMKLLDDTVVVIGADHGENLGEHAYIGHNRLSWPSLHVPLMVKIPKAKGAVLDHPVMNLDIFPTLLNLLGLQYFKEIRGRNLFDSNRQNYFQLAEYDHGKAVKKDGYMLVERNPILVTSPQVFNP